MSTPTDPLSRRERQIMDIVYAAEEAAAADVLSASAAWAGSSWTHQVSRPASSGSGQVLACQSSTRAVRALVGTLEGKGWLRHEQEGRTYVYVPTVPADAASRSALQRVVTAFFGGSSVKAAMALLDLDDELAPEELRALRARIAAAEADGR